MKAIIFILTAVGLIVCLSAPSYSQESKEPKCLLKTSLHYTVEGMAYWYDKAQGGFETVIKLKKMGKHTTPMKQR